jgi:predicted metalloprotease
VVIASVVAILVGGCSTSRDVVVGAPSSERPGALTDAAAVHVAGERQPQAYDGFLAAAIDDLAAFWTDAFPTVADGEPYHDLEGGVWPVWPDARDVPGCGSRRTRYREIEDNAFYCPEEDFIAFDDAQLFPRLDASFGDFTVATVLAHEWGHAIQARVTWSLDGVVRELQADCFAGAWMGHLPGAGGSVLHLTDPDLRRAITGILEFRDDPGTSADDRGAHGSAFDRLGAFQDGLEGGVETCARYASVAPVVIELPFDAGAALGPDSGRSLSSLVSSLPADLDRFWGRELAGRPHGFTALGDTLRTYERGGPYPTCAALSADDYEQGVVYCPDPEFVAYEDGGETARLHDTIGDFSIGVLFGERWAEALQRQLGLDRTGPDALLQRDCLTGAWVADLVPRPTGDQPFVISPGDLDEAVRTYLLFTEGGEQSARAALDRIGSFRGGVFSGPDSCGLGS